MLHTAKQLADQREQIAAKLNKAQVRIYKSPRDDTFVVIQKTVNAYVTYVLSQIHLWLLWNILRSIFCFCKESKCQRRKFQ